MELLFYFCVQYRRNYVRRCEGEIRLWFVPVRLHHDYHHGRVVVDLGLCQGDEETMITYMVVMECGHEDPMSIASFVLYGTPTRWWCSKCKTSKDVVNVLVPETK
jgi:hypothetical protein